MRTIEVTVHYDKLTALDFLKDNPTLVLQNENYFKFVYFEPIGTGLTNFHTKGITIRLFDDLQKNNHWKVARKISPKLMKPEPLAVLQKLEASKLNESRKGQAIELNGWLFDLITNGIYTREDTVLFVRLLFLHGYNFEQVTQLFASIVKRVALAKCFLDQMKIIYKEVSI